MPLRIDYLADHPHLAAVLARWHHGAWGELLSDWTLEAAEAELRTHWQRSAIPTTWIAFDGDEPIGSISLLENDDERIREYSPWLASLFVLEARRGAGVGRALVRRCVDEAAALGVEHIYLYTTEDMGVVDWYRGQGWDVRDRVPFGGQQVLVMATRTGAAVEQLA